MKVTGPGSGLPPEGATPPEEAAGAGGPAFAEKLERAGGTPDAGRAAEAQSGKPGDIADISAELTAGRISAQTAVDRVIGRVLDRQVGADAPTAVRERVEAALRQALEDDPVLAEKLRSLG